MKLYDKRYVLNFSIFYFLFILTNILAAPPYGLYFSQLQGRIHGGAPGALPRPPPKIGKNIIFWSKIVIFHTKYPNNFRAERREAQFF